MNPFRLEGRTTPKHRALTFTLAIPFVLLAVALAQQALVARTQLSPWKGAGFGMFATVDDPRQRHLRVELVGEEAPIALDLAGLSELDERVAATLTRARYVPTEQALGPAAREIASLPWSLDETNLGPTLRLVEPTDTPAPALHQLGRRLVIEVYARRMAAPRYTVELAPLGSLEVTLPTRPPNNP